MSKNVLPWHAAAPADIALARSATGVRLRIALAAEGQPQGQPSREDLDNRVMEAALKKLASNPDWQRYTRLLAEDRRLRRDLAGAMLEIDELKVKRRRLEMEVPPNVAALLLGLDEELKQLDARQGKIRSEAATTAKLLEGASGQAAVVARNAAGQERSKILDGLHSRRSALIDELARKNAASLTEIVGVADDLAGMEKTPSDGDVWAQAILQQTSREADQAAAEAGRQGGEKLELTAAR